MNPTKRKKIFRLQQAAKKQEPVKVEAPVEVKQVTIKQPVVTPEVIEAIVVQSEVVETPDAQPEVAETAAESEEPKKNLANRVKKFKKDVEVGE